MAYLIFQLLTHEKTLGNEETRALRWVSRGGGRKNHIFLQLGVVSARKGTGLGLVHFKNISPMYGLLYKYHYLPTLG